MRIGLRILHPETVQWLRRELEHGELSRAALGRELCERDGWRNPRGALCAASARKALPRLASELRLSLPPAQSGPPRRGCGPSAVAEPLSLTAFCGSLASLGAVGVRVAETAAERQLCGRLLAACHPLGRSRAPGCRLTYLLEAAAGVLGVLSFVSAPLRLGPRDAHLGWGDRTRGSHIGQVVSNDRFLLLPGVRVPHLASHVLGRVVGRLASDWEARHGVRPVLVETCVEASRPGTSYRAAGWACVGRTAGRPPGAAGAVEPKRVWLLGLEMDWAETLRRPPAREPGSFPALAAEDESRWARSEFGRSDLADGRLRSRLERLGSAWERHPGEPLPAVFPGSAEQQAAYRFLHNKKVGGEDILQPHREALVERCRQESAVLLVQDTTTLNYTGLRESTQGLGPLQERTSSARGLFVHAAVAFTEGRRALGVSGLETWARPEAEPAAEREKESRRWFRGFDQGRALGRASPGTRVVVVGDRESDIYGLLKWQAAHADEAGLVVRANAGRQRRVQVWDPHLRATMLRTLASQPDFETPVKTGRAVRIDAQGGKRARRARTAVTELRIGQVALQPPADRPQDGPVTAWVVRVLETEPPAGHEPLEWLLVSSEGGPTAAWAERIVGWYEARWGIEEYFRVLKSGTRIEDRRLQEADALVKCLAFDAITAWRVCSLDRYARDAPDTPAAEVLTEDERQVIGTVVRAERLLPPAERGKPFPPDIRSWVVLLARMAGWHPSKRSPLPGNQVMWRARAVADDGARNASRARTLVVRHVTIFGHGHGLQRAIIDESQHRKPERLIMAQH